MSAKRLLHITFCFILIIASAPLPLAAQQLRYNFKNYTPSDGLPSSEVYQVLRDSDNYMWFATDHGICRYNGYEFKAFNLADNSILGMFEDNRKRLWAYSFSGRLFYYENGKFKDYKWNEKLLKAIKPRVISGIYVDSNEVVQVFTSGPGFFQISAKGLVTDLMKLQLKATCTAIQLSEKKFFSGVSSFPTTLSKAVQEVKPSTEISFRFLNKKTTQIEIPHLVQPERCRVKMFPDKTIFFLSRDCIVQIFPDGKFSFQTSSYSFDDIELLGTNYIIATANGLLIKDSRGNILAEYFKGLHITSIEKDYEGGLWISTLTNGVYYINPLRISHLSEKGEILRYAAKTILQLDDSSLIASVQTNQLIRVKVAERISKMQLKVPAIMTLYKYGKSNIIAGCALGNFDFNTDVKGNKFLFDGYGIYILPSNSNIVLDKNIFFTGTVWEILQFRQSDFKNISQSTLQPNRFFRVSKLFLNSKKEIIAGNQFGLWYYRGNSLTPYDSAKDIFSSRVTDINEYKQKYLCIGTRGKGALVVVRDSIFEINDTTGILSNNIRRILIEKNRIWLATNRGISIVNVLSENPFTYSVKNLSVQDGLLSNEVNDMIDYGSSIVVATNSGISFIDKSNVLAMGKQTLPFYITSVAANGKSIESKDLENLGFKHRNLSIAFETLNFSNSGRNNYRYRLLGYDTNWIYTNDRTIQFNPLPYGNFKLEIQAKREFDSWNQAGNTFSLDVVCNPPFWSSVWFYALLSALFGFASFIFFRRRISVLKKRQNEKESLQRKISETEQMALKSQMNPHFIFNCLNSIQQYVIESDVEGANRFITGFSKLIRQTLDFSAKDKISLEEEMSYLTNYLGLEKARMEDQFKYEVCVQCNHQLSELHVPPLLLQPYVENAIRHGVRHLKNREGVIKLTFKEKGKMLECTIEDNGIGRKLAMQLKSKNPIEYQSKGMSLTAERVELLNKARENPIQIKVEDIEDHAHEISGTRVILMFPL